MPTRNSLVRLLHVGLLACAWGSVAPGAFAQDFLAPLDEQLEAMRLRIESAQEAGRPLDVLAALDYYRVTTLPESRIPASDLLAGPLPPLDESASKTGVASPTHSVVR